MSRILPAIGLLLSAVSCQDVFDPYYLVKDLRLLAIKASPPEYLYDFFGSHEFELQFEALVVDPQGGDVTYQWSFCPVEADRGCKDYVHKRDGGDLTARERGELDAMRATTHPADGIGTARPNADDLALDAAGRRTHGVPAHDIEPFAFTVPGALYEYYFQTSLFGAGLGSWPSAVLNLRAADGRELVTQKRLVVGVKEIRAIAAQLAGEYGYTVCPPDETPADVPGCILIRNRGPNQNPVISQVRLAFSESADAEFRLWAGIPSLPAGSAMRILPVIGEESFESFQTISTNVQTGELKVEDKQEEISISWFCSGGKLQDQLTWPLFTKTLDTVYWAPNKVPEETDGLVTIWMIARDQRGGTSWTDLQVRITPKPD